MPGVIDILQSQARQRGRTEANPLLLLHTLEARPGARISHLPVSQHLAQAWVTLTGEPFRPHQSQALTALRRGEPFALVGGGPAARQTLHLLLYEILRSEPHAAALLLLPDEVTAEMHRAALERLNRTLNAPLTLACVVDGRLPREALAARVLLVTPAALHNRLLRHHDRAWQAFWARLRLLFLIDAEHYAGVAAAHLAALLLRSARLATAPPLLAATLAPVAEAETALRELSGHLWRIIAVDDAPRAVTTLAIWRAGELRRREAAALALAFQREGYTVHIACPQLETALLLPLIGDDTYGISVGPTLRSAQVQILAGYPPSPVELHQALDSGANLTLLLLGNLPQERTLARLAGREEPALPLLAAAPPVWLPPPANAYVAAQHMLCAASERPLTAAEVEHWQAGAIIERLELHHHLGRLPGAALAWQPLPAAGDPYAGFDLTAAGSPAIALYDERATRLASFDPSALDRWAFPGATLPPGRSGYRAVQRDDEAGSVVLRAEHHGRRTFPLRRCTVEVRDERAQRSLRGCMLGWGRVLIEEEVYGYREAQTGSAPAERVLAPALTSKWTAPAVWIDLPRAAGQLPLPGAGGQQMGWSLAAALPLRVICAATDVTPAYDAQQRRLYLIDAQPGGNGLAAWVYANLEALLPLAYDIALDCRNDSLLEPLAHADKDWLLLLLGGATTVTEPPARLAPAAPPAPAPQLAPLPEESLADEEPLPIAPAAPPPVSLPPPAAPARAPVEPPPAERRRGRGNDARRSAAETRAAPPSKPAPERRSRRAPPTEPPRPRTDAPPAREPRRQAHATPPEEPPRPRTAAPPPEEPPRPGRAVPPTPPLDAPPDASAMVARLRRMREQREAAARTDAPAPPRRPAESAPIAPRFAPGDRVFCLPYGDGEVRASWIEDDKELLSVVFPDFGDLTVDPAVSLVRRIETQDDAEAR